MEEARFLCAAVNTEKGLSHPEGWRNHRKRQHSDAEKEVILQLLLFASSDLIES